MQGNFSVPGFLRVNQNVMKNFHQSLMKMIILLHALPTDDNFFSSTINKSKYFFWLIGEIFFLQVTGKCGSVQVRLIPAPRGTGIVGAPVPKKLLQMAGIEDCYTSARGSTGTLGNFG